MSGLPRDARVRLIDAVGADWIRDDPTSLVAYGTDALQKGAPADLVLLPGSTQEVASIAALCDHHRIPMVVRGAGTGYTGGAVPLFGGVVIAMDRLNKILEIDEENLLAVVQPDVITGDLQDAVEARGLFYPPDPASLRQSSIGGNVAECAGGPRAFKYGTTKRYVLALEAVLPSGEIIRTGSKAVKNVVGYDLTQLLVGSEGTLAILTEITLRLVPKPAAQATLRASFRDVSAAGQGVTALLAARVVPSTIELIDDASLRAVERHIGRRLAPDGTRALLIIEVDGVPAGVAEETTRVAAACRQAGAIDVDQAASDVERQIIWEARRQLSYALRALAPLKINHDVVVPRGRLPQLFELVDRIRRDEELLIACFGHAGDGNIHVNMMIDPADERQAARAGAAQQRLFEGVVALEGSISGEHGIGFAKAPYLALELSAEVIALMKRLKTAFDPHGVLNPGKIWPPQAAEERRLT